MSEAILVPAAPSNPAAFVYNDGGREAAGYKGSAGDCVCRAVAIAAQLPYQEVYNRLAEGNASQRKSKRTGKQPWSARNGIYTTRKWFKDYMRELGFVWTPTMQIGSGCQVHLKADELPSGRLVGNVSRHQVAVIDGSLTTPTTAPEREPDVCTGIGE